MIDRYSITATPARIRERFHAEMLDSFSPRYNAAPSHLLPVIMHDSPHGVSTFYWGNSPEWSNNRALGEKLINIQAETIPDKGALRKSLMRSRCIIPADGFYAWKKVGKRTSIPYRFVTTDQELFSLAGFWEEFEDANSRMVHTFRIITIPSNGMVASIHDRMPVLLNPSGERVWLDKQSNEVQLLNLLQAYPSAQMNYYPVSPRISDERINVPSLIMPTSPADQFGNLTLFD